jgi:hypothetical protein
VDRGGEEGGALNTERQGDTLRGSRQRVDRGERGKKGGRVAICTHSS